MEGGNLLSRFEHDVPTLAGSSQRQYDAPANHEYVCDAVLLPFECDRTYARRVFEDENIGLIQHNEDDAWFAALPAKNGLSSKGLQFVRSMTACEESVESFGAGELRKGGDGESEGFMEHFQPIGVSGTEDRFSAIGLQLSPAMMEDRESLTDFEPDGALVAVGSKRQSESPENHEFVRDGDRGSFNCCTYGGRVLSDHEQNEIIVLNDEGEHGTSCALPTAKIEFLANRLELLPSMMDSGESLVTFDAGGLLKEHGEGEDLMQHFEPVVAVSREDESEASEFQLPVAMEEDGKMLSGFESDVAVVEGSLERQSDGLFDHEYDCHEANGVSFDSGGTYREEFSKDQNVGLNFQNKHEVSSSSPSANNRLLWKGLQLLPSIVYSEESLRGFETSLTGEVGPNGFHMFPSMESGETLSGFQSLLTAESPKETSIKSVNHEHLENCVAVRFDCEDTAVYKLAKEEECETSGIDQFEDGPTSILPPAKDEKCETSGVDQFEDGPTSILPQVKDEFVEDRLPVLASVMERGDSSVGLESSITGGVSGRDSERPVNLRGGDVGRVSLDSIYGYLKGENVVSNDQEQQTSSSLSPSKDESEAIALQSLPTAMGSGDAVAVAVSEFSQLLARSERQSKQPVNQGLDGCNGAVDSDDSDLDTRRSKLPGKQGRDGINGAVASDDSDLDTVPPSEKDKNLVLNDQDKSGTSSALVHEKNELVLEGLELCASPIESPKVLAGSETSEKTGSLKRPPERPVKHNLGNGVRVSFESRSYSTLKGAEKSFRDEQFGGERKQEVAVPVWVKWRGKWETAIQCCSIDCPVATLKSKPNYSKKIHVVVYFPSTRTFLWVDTNHMRPISESPMPLLRGTHASGLDAVKDESLPRRRMIIKLGGEMLDISDRLHIKAVVDSSQNVNVWKTFAKEAAAATRYEELGALLVRLHLTIHPGYIKPGWMARRYSSWKEESTKSGSAASVQKLTRELINAVLWDEVAPLWNTPEQPELDPEWEHWKGEAFEEKFSEEDPVARICNSSCENETAQGMQICVANCSKRFKDQARARHQSQGVPENIKAKRSKPNSKASDLSVGLVSSSCGHATTAFRSTLVHPSPLLQGEQQVLDSRNLQVDNCFEVVPGLTLASSSGNVSPVKNKTHNLAEPLSRVAVMSQGNQLHLPISGDTQTASSIIQNERCAGDFSGGSLDGLPFFNSGLCSAFLKKKNRRCNRLAKEGITYCGKHKHVAKLGSAGGGEVPTSEGVIAWESGLCSASIRRESTRCVKKTIEGSSFCLTHVDLDAHKVADHNGELPGREEQLDLHIAGDASVSDEARCNGITTRGIRCTHKPKDGVFFCVKHSIQGIIVQVEECKTQTAVRGLPQIDWQKETEKRIGSKVHGQASIQNLSAGPSGAVFGQRSLTSTEAKSVGKDGTLRKRKWISSFFSDSAQTMKSSMTLKQELPLHKVSESRTETVLRCAGRTTRNDEQCSFRARAGHTYCSKHLMAIDSQKQGQNDDLKASCVSLSQDLLERYLKAAEGISSEAHGSESHRLLLKWTRAEAAKDYSLAEELLKLVTLEMSKVQTVLQPKKAREDKNAGVNGTVRSSFVQEIGKVVEGTMSVRCDLCDTNFPAKADLGKHWMDAHRKDVALFVRGYACRACSRLYSRKHTVRRHWKKRHQSLPVMSPDWFAVCVICNLHFADHNLLLHHVVSEHSDHLCKTGLKNLVLLNGADNLVEQETAKTLECTECHENFSTHWDLFDHKERKHKSLGAKVNGPRALKSNENNVNDLSMQLQPKSNFFGCRICGKKFSFGSDLKQHKQAEHLSLSPAGTNQVGSTAKRSADSESGRVKLPIRRKADEMLGLQTLGPRRSKRRFRLQSDKKSNEKGPEIGKEALLFRMKAAVQTAQLRTIRQSKRSDASMAQPRKALYSLTKGGQMLPFDGETTCKIFPDDRKLLDAATSACCKSKLFSSLDQKYTKVPDQLLLRVNEICNAANFKLQWQAEAYVCQSGCQELNTVVDCEMQRNLCKPLASVKLDGPRLSKKYVNESGLCHPDLENLVSKPATVRFCSDLSNGKEPVPVACFVDEDVIKNWASMQKGASSSSETFKPWDDFNYITERVLDPSLGLDPENYKVGCSCEKVQCSPESCDHVDIFDNDNFGAMDIYGQLMKGRFPYDENGCIILEEGYLVYECNSSCRCQKTCQNRVLQKGVNVKLEVFRTIQKGWAVRAAQMIRRGTFVCEYIGEVLRDGEANKRGERYDQVGCSYLYDIDAHIDISGKLGRSKPFVIDATKHGNVARFINHSCSPNLINYQVLVDSMDCQLAHIGLFASRDIEFGEELAYDYRYRLLPGRGCACHCGAQNCRGRLY